MAGASGWEGRRHSIAQVMDLLRQRYGWKLDNPLGDGGFNYVFREEIDGLPRAVKISKDPVDPDWESNTLEMVRHLNGHPHLLQLVKLGKALGHVVTVWELADGTLESALQERLIDGRGPFSAQELLPWMEEAAEAIDALNQRGIYHGDINPGNLFLVQGHVKVGDFGLVKRVGPRMVSRWGLRMVGHIPPECYRFGAWFSQEPVRWRDVYGLCASYVRLRTGRAPFGETVPEAIERLKRGQYERKGLSPAEIACLDKVLQPEAGERWGCRPAREWVRELRQAIENSGDSRATCGDAHGNATAVVAQGVIRPTIWELLSPWWEGRASFSRPGGVSWIIEQAILGGLMCAYAVCALLLLLTGLVTALALLAYSFVILGGVACEFVGTLTAAAVWATVQAYRRRGSELALSELVWDLFPLRSDRKGMLVLGPVFVPIAMFGSIGGSLVAQFVRASVLGELDWFRDGILFYATAVTVITALVGALAALGGGFVAGCTAALVAAFRCAIRGRPVALLYPYLGGSSGAPASAGLGFMCMVCGILFGFGEWWQHSAPPGDVGDGWKLVGKLLGDAWKLFLAIHGGGALGAAGDVGKLLGDAWKLLLAIYAGGALGAAIGAAICCAFVLAGLSLGCLFRFVLSVIFEPLSERVCRAFWFASKGGLAGFVLGLMTAGVAILAWWAGGRIGGLIGSVGPVMGSRLGPLLLGAIIWLAIFIFRRVDNETWLERLLLVLSPEIMLPITGWAVWWTIWAMAFTDIGDPNPMSRYWWVMPLAWCLACGAIGAIIWAIKGFKGEEDPFF